MAHVGNAYVHVRPEVKGFFVKLRKDLQGEEKRDGQPTKVKVSPEFDRDKFASSMDDAIQDYNERHAGKGQKIKVEPVFDQRKMNKSLDEAFGDLERDVYVDVRVRGEEKLAGLAAQIAALTGKRHVVDVDVSQADLDKAISGNRSVVVATDVDTDRADLELNRIRQVWGAKGIRVPVRPRLEMGEFDTLRGDLVDKVGSLSQNVKIGFDAASKKKFFAELDGLSADRQKTVTVKTSGVSKAIAEIKTLEAALDRLGGKTAVRVSPEVNVPDAPERREVPSNLEGRMKVHPELSTDAFVRDYETFLAGLNREVEVKVRAVPDTSALDADLARPRKSKADAPKADKPKQTTKPTKPAKDITEAVSEVRVDLDAAAAEARLDTLTRDRTVNVKVNLDGDGLDDRIAAAAKKVAAKPADNAPRQPEGGRKPAVDNRPAAPTANTSGNVLSTNKGHTLIDPADVDRVMNPKLYWEGIAGDWAKQVKHSPLVDPATKATDIDFAEYQGRDAENKRRLANLYEAMAKADEARAKSASVDARLERVIDSRPEGKRRQAQRRQEIADLRDRSQVRGRQADRAQSAYSSESADWKGHIKDIRNQVAPLVETVSKIHQANIRRERAERERDARTRRLQDWIKQGKADDGAIARERAAINDAHKRLIRANKEISALHGEYREAVRKDREMGSPIGIPEDYRNVRAAGAAPDHLDDRWGASSPISARPAPSAAPGASRTDRDRARDRDSYRAAAPALDLDIPRRANRNAEAIDGLNDSLSRLGRRGTRSAAEGMTNFAGTLAKSPMRGLFSLQGAITGIGKSMAGVGSSAAAAGKGLASFNSGLSGGGKAGGAKAGYGAVAQLVSNLAMAFFKLKMAVGGLGMLGGAAFDGLAGGAAILSSLLRPAVHATKLLLGLPTLIGAAGAAAATAALAFNGMGDALKSIGDDTAFEEAVANLTPSAQAFARSVKSIVPAMRELRDTTQEAMFDGMADSFDRLATGLVPILNQQLPTLAGHMGDFADSAMRAFSSAEGLDLWDRGLTAINEGFAAAVPGVEQFMSGLHRMVAVGAEQLLPELGQAFTDLGAKFNNWANEGNLTRIFDQAKKGLQDFSSMVGSTWTGLSGFFSSMADGADMAFSEFGGTVEWAKTKLEQFSQWANSDVGSAQIAGFFEDATASAQRLGDIIGGLGSKFVTDFMPNFRSTLEEYGGSIERLGEKFIDFAGDATESFGKVAKAADDGIDWWDDFNAGFDRFMRHDWDGLNKIVSDRGLRKVANAAQDAGIAIKEIPSQKEIIVEMNSTEAVDIIEDLGGKVRELSDGSVHIEFDSVEDAQKAAYDLEQKIKDLPDGEVKVQHEEALAAIEAMHMLHGTSFAPISIDVEANTEAAFAKLQEITGAALAFDGSTRQIHVEALTDGAQQALADVGFKVQALPDGGFAVTYTNQGEVDAAIEALADQVRNLPEGEARISAEAALGTLVALRAAITDGAPADIPTELTPPSNGGDIQVDPISVETELEAPAQPEFEFAAVSVPTEADTAGFDNALLGVAPPPVRVPTEADTSGLDAGVSGFTPASVRVSTEADTAGLAAGISGYVPATVQAPVTADLGQFHAAVGGLTVPPKSITVTVANLGTVQGQLSALGNAISAILTVTSNVAEVQGQVDNLNNPLAATHTISSNVGSIISQVDSLAGRNTSSTHTVNIVTRGKMPGNATGGFVGGGGGVNWSGLPGFATGGVVGKATSKAWNRLPRYAVGGMLGGAAAGAASSAALAAARRLMMAMARQARQQVTDMARSGLSNMTRQGMAGITGGGLLFGPGSGTSDDILGLDASGIPTARVSNGEFVTKESAVNRDTLPYLTAINNGWTPPSEEELERQRKIEEARTNRYENFHAGFIAEDIANFYMDDIGSLTGLKLNLETMKETPWYRLAFGNEEARNAAVSDIRRQKEQEERDKATAEREAAKQQERENAKMDSLGDSEEMMDTAGQESATRTEMAQVRETQTRADGGTRSVTVHQNVGAINTYSETAAVRRYRRATEGAVTHALSI